MYSFGTFFTVACILAGTCSTVALIESRGPAVARTHAAYSVPTERTEPRTRVSETPRVVRQPAIRTTERPVPQRHTEQEVVEILPEPVVDEPETLPVEEVQVPEPREVLPAQPVKRTSLDEDAKTFLALHNDVREDVGVPPLTWSEALAKDAKRWAEELSDRGCVMDHSGEPYGENIFKLWSTDSDVRGTPARAVTWWADEEAYYDHDTNTCEPGEICGHYTQMVWESATSVGCGASMCTEGDTVTDLFVCRYDPIGNIPGQRPY